MDADEAVRSEIAALNRQDVDGVMAYYTQDVVFDDISAPEPLRGAAAMRQFMEDLYTAFPDAHVELRNIFSDGRYVAAEYEFAGTHRGNFSGRAGTGRGFRVKAMSVYDYNGSKFTRETFYWDSASLMAQLGLD